MKHENLTVAALLACLACAPAHEDDHGHEGPPAAAAAQPTDTVSIPPTVRRNLGITFARVEVREVERTLRVPGAFELQPLARHEYRMALPGRVRMAVDQYDRVEPGQVLFRYQSPAWPELLHEIVVGEQEMETARVRIVFQRAKLDEARRKLELARERIAALARADFKKADLEVEAGELEASLPRLEAELLLAETELGNARRTHEHALHRAAAAAGIEERELEAMVEVDGEPVPAYRTIDWVEVRALEPGVVEALAVTDGAFVEPPATVLSTVDPDRIRFRALALQADLPKLSETETARIVPPHTDGLAIDDAIEADLTIGLEAHPRERTLTLLATPRSGAPWIRPGVSAFLEVVVDASGGPSLAVPRSAVVRHGLVHVFFRRDPDDPDKAIRVEADMGVSDGRWIALGSGVRRGDEVVLHGAYELKLALQQAGGGAPAGHTHADGSFHTDDH